MIPTNSDIVTIPTRLCIIGEADPFLTRLVRRVVEKSGFKTRRAQTGESILELCYHEKPVLIVLEPDLPGKVRGWEAIQKLKKDSQTSRIAVIHFSWLKKDEVKTLVGQEVIHLQKPDLKFEDFANALVLAGLLNPPINPTE